MSNEIKEFYISYKKGEGSEIYSERVNKRTAKEALAKFKRDHYRKTGEYIEIIEILEFIRGTFTVKHEIKNNKIVR